MTAWEWYVGLAPGLAASAGLCWIAAWIRWHECTRLMKQVRELACLGCGYPLKPSWPCPECGVKCELDDA